jgi:hypothetical protein
MVRPPTVALRHFVHRQCRIEPIIYETVMLADADSSDMVFLFMRTFDSKPASFFAKHVKHLCLDHSVPLEYGKRILSACTSVGDLACWMYADEPEYLPLSIPFKPKRLSISPGLFLGVSGGIDFGDYMFQCSSHLEIEINTYPIDYSKWSTIHLIPNLTHLAFSFWERRTPHQFPHLLNHILLSCKSLEVLALLISERSKCSCLHQYPILGAVDQQDPRIVLVPCSLTLAAWERGAQGDDFWTLAERRVLEKRQNVSRLVHATLKQSLIGK